MVLRRALLAPLALAWAQAAGAGTIEGRVDVRRPAMAGEEGAERERPGGGDRLRTVVYLQRAPQGAFEAPERPRAVLDQQDETFVPYVLAVATGTTVDFPNSDRTYHNVFSLSRGARFDLGRYGRGQSKSVRFDRPGVVRVFCDIHSHMNAFVLVFAHRYFATTDSGGRYRIPGVPAGSYTLVAWNDGADRATTGVSVPGEGTVTADFAFP